MSKKEAVQAAPTAEPQKGKNECTTSFPMPILTRVPADVKMLEEFQRRNIPNIDIIDTMRTAWPGFDKSLLSKCRNYKHYGVGLRREAVKLLSEHFHLEAPEAKRQLPLLQPLLRGVRKENIMENIQDIMQEFADEFGVEMEADQEVQRFVIDTDAKAEWAIRKIAEEQADHDRLVACCQEEIDRYTERQEAYHQRFEKRTANLRAMLLLYFGTVPVKETKTQQKYELPSGSLVMKKPSSDFKADTDAIDHAETNLLKCGIPFTDGYRFHGKNAYNKTQRNDAIRRKLGLPVKER